MKTLRWLTFLPVAAILIGVAQLVTGGIATALPAWIAVPLVFFFGIVIALATMVPVRWTPNHKIAATILLSVFLLLEAVALLSQVGGISIAQVIVRILTDIFLVLGALAPALDDRNARCHDAKA